MTKLQSTLVDFTQLLITDLKPQEGLKALAKDIKDAGMHHPIVIWDKVVVDGNRRVAAQKTVGVNVGLAYVVTDLATCVRAMTPAMADHTEWVPPTWLYWGRLLQVLSDLDSPDFAKRTTTAGRRSIVSMRRGKGSYFTQTVAPLMGYSPQTVQRWRRVWEVATAHPDEKKRDYAWAQVQRVELGESTITIAYDMVMENLRDAPRSVRMNAETVDIGKLSKEQREQRDLFFHQLATISGAATSLVGHVPLPHLAADVSTWRQQINRTRTQLMSVNRALQVLEDQ